MIEFKHNKLTYRVRVPNLFDEGTLGALIVDTANTILKAKGYENGTDSDNIPRLLDTMIYKFVAWMQITDIDGECPYDVNLYSFSAKDVGAFDAWREQITLNPDLAGAWQKAYEDAKGKKDPLAPSKTAND